MATRPQAPAPTRPRRRAAPPPRQRASVPPSRFEPERPSLVDRLGVGHLDYLLLFAALGLIVCSVVTIAAATHDDIPDNPNYYVIRQIIYAIVGVAAMVAVMRIDYSRFRELRVGLYAGLVTAIMLVLVFGSATRGSRRWIELPYFTFQPSEIGKVILIVALAGFVIDQAWRVTGRQRTVRLLLLGLIPAFFVAVQPDLGTAIVFGVATLAVLFVAGVRWTHFAALGAVAVGAAAVILVIAPAVGAPLLKDYQQSRLTAFLNPSDDPRDSSYQSRQALIAVGAGQKTGRGDEATQTRLDFIPERRTDFIFAVVGERYGFVGAGLVLSLFALLIWRALRILTLAKNLYGTLIAGGIVAMLMFQVFVNVGMSLGIMPITGIPLPLMSYGGSSVLTTFLAIGLLQSIYTQSQLAPRSRASTPVLS